MYGEKSWIPAARFGRVGQAKGKKINANQSAHIKDGTYPKDGFLISNSTQSKRPRPTALQKQH